MKSLLRRSVSEHKSLAKKWRDMVAKRPFKAQPSFYRNGISGSCGSWRSWKTLRSAIRGIRLDVAQLQADGEKMPIEIIVWIHYENRHGSFQDSEVAAIWKRGRFVWVDPMFKETK